VTIADAEAAERIESVVAEERERAAVYRLLGRLLCAPPDAECLRVAGELVGDDSEFGRALDDLARQARATDEAAARNEYAALFVGLVRGELLPYASYYLTGFLHEKPLARLRTDMARLGIARAEQTSEPEDHMGALCEMMAGLIEGDFGAPAALETQRAFFDAHVEPWAELFFTNLATAESAQLYAPVGRLGRAFITIEREAFALED
jgi:TorA maturation chaperone TorD